MQVIAFSKSGNTNRHDMPSPKGWDEAFGPRSEITHIKLFILLELNFAPVSQFLEWLYHNEDFHYVASFILRTRWNIYTKEQKIQEAINDLWLQWFKKAVFFSEEYGTVDLKDTLQYMADVGFTIKWTNDEQRMFVLIAKINRKYGRGRGSTARSKGAVKRFADKLRIDIKQKNTHAIIPGLQYGGVENQFNNFGKNYNNMLKEARLYQDYKKRKPGISDKRHAEWKLKGINSRALLHIHKENMAIKAEMGFFDTDVDREDFIYNHYEQLLENTIREFIDTDNY